MTDGRAIQILLVEDDPAHAEIVRRNLADFAVANAITHLADGQLALDYLSQAVPGASDGPHPWPDLILLDLRLPRVDGIEVLQWLKASPTHRRIPIVILTTSSAERDVVAAYDEGAVSYLVKPVDCQQFAALLESFGFYWLNWNQFPQVAGRASE